MANDKKRTGIAKGVVSKSRFSMCGSGKDKAGNVGTVVQEENRSS